MPDSPPPMEAPDSSSQPSRGEAVFVPAAAGAQNSGHKKDSHNSAAAEVLARAQAGDHEAFAQLYSLHKRRIYSLCLRMVGNIAGS